MAGFHLPGDPYFPKQGNGGWIEPEPEEEPEEGLAEPVVDSEEEESDDDDVDDSDAESVLRSHQSAIHS